MKADLGRTPRVRPGDGRLVSRAAEPALRLRAALMALLVVGGLASGPVGCGGGEDESAGGPPPPRPARVEVVTLEPAPLTVTRRYLGEVRPADRATLSAGASGEVIMLEVREGARVDAGQVLVEIDSTMARAQLRESRAVLTRLRVERDQADRDAERARRLAERSVTAAAEVERLEAVMASLGAQVQSASASVRALQSQVDDRQVVAPFSGQVLTRHVDVGDWVQAGTPVLALASADQTEVLVRVPDVLLDELGDVNEVQLRLGGREGTARIVGVVGVLDAATRTALLRLAPDADADWLRAGGTVDVVFSYPAREDGIVVPTDAIVYGVAAPRIIRVQDGAAESLNVQVVHTADDRALIRSGELSYGDRVVVRGNERLRPGQPLEVVDHE